MSLEPRIVSLKDIGKLKRFPSRPVLVHLSQREWKVATKGIKTVGLGAVGDPPQLEILAIPEKGGGVLLAPYCAPRPQMTCFAVPLTEKGLDDRQHLFWVCVCMPNIPSPTPTLPRPGTFPTAQCGVHVGTNFFGCSGSCTAGQRCNTILSLGPNGIWRIFCRCG
jgi:hypothetical protein